MNRKHIPTTYDEARAMLNGRTTRTIANNTTLVDQGEGVIGLRLHSTVVVVFDDSGHIILNTGGYRTTTTKDRLNRVARAHGWSVYAKRFDWFVSAPDGAEFEFEDGFTIPPAVRNVPSREDHCTHPEQDWCDCDWCRGCTMKRCAWRFFMEHAGYATPPGRAVCAATRARAEEQAEAAGLVFEWVPDECPDLSWMDEAEAARDHEVLGCIVRDPAGEHLASLWGIVDADTNYRRVIEAELAAEALEGYAAPMAGCP